MQTRNIQYAHIGYTHLIRNKKEETNVYDYMFLYIFTLY